MERCLTSLIIQFSSVAQSCPTLCDPMNRSTPGLPVHHQLPEFTQTHVHWVGDVIQPSHPLSSPSPAPNPSQHQSLFQWVNYLHEVAKVLEFQLSISPFKEIPGLISFRMDWLDLLAVQGTLESSPTPQFKSINSSVLSYLHKGLKITACATGANYGQKIQKDQKVPRAKTECWEQKQGIEHASCTQHCWRRGHNT